MTFLRWGISFPDFIFSVNKLTDFDETCTDTLLGGWEELFIFFATLT